MGSKNGVLQMSRMSRNVALFGGVTSATFDVCDIGRSFFVPKSAKSAILLGRGSGACNVCNEMQPFRCFAALAK